MQHATATASSPATAATVLTWAPAARVLVLSSPEPSETGLGHRAVSARGPEAPRASAAPPAPLARRAQAQAQAQEPDAEPAPTPNPTAPGPNDTVFAAASAAASAVPAASATGPTVEGGEQPSASEPEPALPMAGATSNWTGLLQAPSPRAQLAGLQAEALRQTQRHRTLGELLLALERVERSQRLQDASATTPDLRCVAHAAVACDAPAERSVLLLLAANRHRLEPGTAFVRRSGRWYVERLATAAG